MKKIIVLMMVSVFALASNVAFADSEDDGGPKGKGKRHAHFQKMDANGDGVVDFDEFKQAHEKRVEKMFNHIDKDGDGALTADEMKGAKKKWRKHRKHEKKEKRKGKRKERKDNEDEGEEIEDVAE